MGGTVAKIVYGFEQPGSPRFRHRFRLRHLDINLKWNIVFSAAESLKRQNIPFIFCHRLLPRLSGRVSGCFGYAARR